MERPDAQLESVASLRGDETTKLAQAWQEIAKRDVDDEAIPSPIREVEQDRLTEIFVTQPNPAAAVKAAIEEVLGNPDETEYFDHQDFARQVINKFNAEVSSRAL